MHGVERAVGPVAREDGVLIFRGAPTVRIPARSSACASPRPASAAHSWAAPASAVASSMATPSWAR
jgi:hypothetical protein